MHTVSEGDGPVNALDGALRKALQPFYPAAGGDAPGRLQGARRQRPGRDGGRVRVVIEWRDGNDVWGTVGVSENIIEASWLALVDASSTNCSRTRNRTTETRARQKPGSDSAL